MRLRHATGLLLTLVLAACATPEASPAPAVVAPDPTPAVEVTAPAGPTPVAEVTAPVDPAAPTATQLPPGDQPPADRLVRIDTAALSEDGLVLTLRFTGGRPFQPGDPCTNAYAGWAAQAEGVLRAAVVDVTPSVPGPVGCDAMGHGRSVVVELGEPYTGARLEDLAGGVHFLRAPDGLVEIRGLEAGWDLLWEGDASGGGAGRWQRTWSPRQELPSQSGPGRIDLYQAFDGPVDVTGGDGVGEPVKVNGTPATLYRWPPSGELVLVWSVDGTELALVANQGDFSEPDVILLAESVALPGTP